MERMMKIWFIIWMVGISFCADAAPFNKYLSKAQQRRIEKIVADKGYEVCVEWLEKIQDKYQGDFLFWMYKGICYSNMPGQGKNAEEAFDHSIALGKDRVEIYEVKYYQALYYFNQNRFDECNVICMEALSRVRQWKEGARERYEALLTALQRKQTEVLAAQKQNVQMSGRQLQKTSSEDTDTLERQIKESTILPEENADNRLTENIDASGTDTGNTEKTGDDPVPFILAEQDEEITDAGIGVQEDALLAALAKYKKTITYTPQLQMTTDQIHQALEAGQDILICEVFNFNRIELNHNGNRFLELLSQVMLKNKSLKIEVSVHCDYIGSIRINRDFAMRRLKNIENVLTSRHIPLKNLIFTPCGSERPRKITEAEAKEYPFLREGDVLNWDLLKGLTRQQRATGHMLNRRVEIRKLQ